MNLLYSIYKRKTSLSHGLTILGCFFILISSATFVDASDYQDMRDSAASYLRSAEQNIDAAKGSAGRSKKLTMIRLNYAKKGLEKANGVIEALSSSGQATDTLKERYSAADKSINSIEATFHSGKPAPAHTVTNTLAAKVVTSKKSDKTAAVTRLGYQQEETLSNAKWYLRETNGFIAKATTVAERLKVSGKKPLHREVKAALSALDSALSKHKQATGFITQLPAAQHDVSVVQAQITEAGNAITSLKSKLGSASSQLDKVTNLNNYPNYNQDYELSRSLAGRYANFSITSSKPEKLIAVIKEDGHAFAALKQFASIYAPLARQKTAAGIKMEKQIIFAFNQRKQFVTEAIAYKKELPQKITDYIEDAKDRASTAVSDKKFRWFGVNGIIAKNLERADEKNRILKAFNPSESKPFEDRIAATRIDIAKQAKSLEADIIANNALPPNKYSASDREGLEKLAIKTWDKKQSDAELLSIRIPTGWERNTKVEWQNNAFYKVDTSNLQVQLIIKYNDTLAIIRPINIYKDHMNGDTLTAFPLNGMAHVRPTNLLQLNKIK